MPAGGFPRVSIYCEPADVYDRLPRGITPNPGRLVSDVSPTTEIMSLDAHGFRANAQLLFRAESGGSLPSPLVESTVYFAIPRTDSTFSIAATSGGSAINITTAGSNVVVTTPLPIDAAIGWASSMVESFLPAHVVPLEAPYPVLIVTTTADLAASQMLTITGGATVDIQSKLMAAQKMLDRWAKAIPIRGTNAPKPANTAITGTVAGADPRGWVGPRGNRCIP